MSFQGQGSGILGTSNQFSVGYAQSAGSAQTSGNASYAAIAGSATSSYSAYTAQQCQQGGGNTPIHITGGTSFYNIITNNSGLSQMFNNGVNYILGSQAVAFQGTISCYFAYSAYTGGRWFIASDKRIKKRVTDEQPQYLTNINKLAVERFTYIDTLKNGTDTVSGFFAQDVESVIPNAIQKSPDYIPNVMKQATKVDGQRITCECHGLLKDDQIKMHIDKGEGAIGIYGTVTNIIDENTFEVDNKEIQEPLFVYGKLVYDFSILDENKILPHTVGAIQELHSLIKLLEKRIENLELLVIK